MTKKIIIKPKIILFTLLIGLTYKIHSQNMEFIKILDINQKVIENASLEVNDLHFKYVDSTGYYTYSGKEYIDSEKGISLKATHPDFDTLAYEHLRSLSSPLYMKRSEEMFHYGGSNNLLTPCYGSKNQLLVHVNEDSVKVKSLDYYKHRKAKMKAVADACGLKIVYYSCDHLPKKNVPNPNLTVQFITGKPNKKKKKEQPLFIEQVSNPYCSYFICEKLDSSDFEGRDCRELIALRSHVDVSIAGPLFYDAVKPNTYMFVDLFVRTSDTNSVRKILNSFNIKTTKIREDNHWDRKKYCHIEIVQNHGLGFDTYQIIDELRQYNTKYNFPFISLIPHFTFE